MVTFKSLPKAKKNKNQLKNTISEDLIQGECEVYLQKNGFTYIHLPQEMYTFIYGGTIGWALSAALRLSFKFPAAKGLVGSLKSLSGMQQNLRSLLSKSLGGLPDLIAFHPDGRFFAAELKTKTGTVQQNQRNWHKGLPVKIIRSTKEFIEQFEKWDNHYHN